MARRRDTEITENTEITEKKGECRRLLILFKDISIDATVQRGGKQGEEPTAMIEFLLEAVSQIRCVCLSGLLARCFVAPRSQIAADMLPRRASHRAKISRNPHAAYL